MIYPKGHIVKYEATEKGRKRAAALLAQFPVSTAPVLKAPHHVELLSDFEFRPVANRSSSR